MRDEEKIDSDVRVASVRELLKDEALTGLTVTETGSIHSHSESAAFNEGHYDCIKKIAKIDPAILVDRKRYLSEFEEDAQIDSWQCSGH